MVKVDLYAWYQGLSYEEEFVSAKYFPFSKRKGEYILTWTKIFGVDGDSGTLFLKMQLVPYR